MISMDFCENRFGRDEHHRAVTGFRWQDIFAGNVIHMFLHVDLELFLCQCPAGIIRLPIEHAMKIFQWEF